MRLVLPLALGLTFGLLAGCGPEAADAEAAGAPGGSAFAGQIVEVASAEALVDDLDALEAEVVVLNFWATWCGPCRLEFPEFVRYSEEMEGTGVHVRFVSLDQERDLAMVEAFLAEHGVDGPAYLYTGQGDVTSQLNPFVGNALPITMVLDGEGIVQDTHVGVMSYDQLTAAVDGARAAS